jgi:hypothetical protein
MTISPKAVLVFLSSFAGAFFVIFLILVLSHSGLAPLTADPLVVFNVDAEVSIPTWYAQILLFVASGLLFLIAKLAKEHRKYWYILAGIVLFVSIDEGASIHELLIVPVRELLQISQGPLYYTWVIIYGIALAVVGLFFVRFFACLPAKTRWLFAFAMGLFLMGALGMEMVGGLVVSTHMPELLYAVVVGTEELLEMLGVATFIYALLEYAARYKSLPKVVIAK